VVVVLAATSDLIVVTTGVDEDDPGATPGSPGGSGLSLREAMRYADATAGQQTIWIPAGTVVNLTSQLFTPTDNAGVVIIGDGAVVDGSGMGGVGNSCVDIGSDNNRVYGLEIRNCPGWPIYLYGTGNRVARCRIHDNGWGIEWAGTGNTFGPNNDVYANGAVPGITVTGPHVIEWNRIHGHAGGAGLRLTAAADGTQVIGNTIFGNAGGVDIDSNSNGNVLWHNTIHGNAGPGLNVASNVSGTDFRNSIVSQNTGWGIRAGVANFAQIDFLDVFGNTSGTCSTCGSLGAHSLQVDPGYVDAAGGDLRLLMTSPLIDAGTDLGLDVNGPAPGSYYGAAPDLGAWEAR
jgi:parallel beta-helix repeat protein